MAEGKESTLVHTTRTNEGRIGAAWRGLRNVSERTVLRDWDKARLLLNRLLGGAGVGLQGRF